MTEQWRWDGDDLWHEGYDYNDPDNPHRYIGIKTDIHPYTNQLKYDMLAIKMLPNIIEAINKEYGVRAGIHDGTGGDYLSEVETVLRLYKLELGLT